MTEFELHLCQPKSGPFQVASTLGDLFVAAKGHCFGCQQGYTEPVYPKRVGAHGFAYNPTLLGRVEMHQLNIFNLVLNYFERTNLGKKWLNT